jgi:hypothetical protein
LNLSRQESAAPSVNAVTRSESLAHDDSRAPAGAAYSIPREDPCAIPGVGVASPLLSIKREELATDTIPMPVVGPDAVPPPIAAQLTPQKNDTHPKA